MHFLNSFQAAVSAALFSQADALVGISPGEGIMPQIKTYEPEFLDLQKEAGVSAAVARCLSGKRVLLKDPPGFQDMSSRRLPVVCTSRRIHNYSLCIAPASAQEAFESVIAAYAVGQDRKVLMPSCIVIDDVLRQTFESVELVGHMTVRNAAGELSIDKRHRLLERHDTEGLAQQHKALKNAHSLMHEFSADWKKKTKSHLHLVERYHLDDAELAFVSYGSATSNAKLAVRFLREKQNEKVGLLSLRMMRPFPDAEVADALKNVKKIAIVDNAFSLGTWSRLYQEVKTVYGGFALNVLSQFTSTENFIEIFGQLKTAEKPDRIWNM
ncbi:MAG: hypothetical protein HYW25_01290 [Candidatus Aenigmarchaeota archaeon]|nr:hypothetical protein [Candidatus Aenigmarchaeota archaeon]